MNIILFSETEILNPLSLNDERAQHIVKVLKKDVGDNFFAGIVNGVSGNAQITSIDSAFLHFEFTPLSEAVSPPSLALIIGFPRPIQLKRLLRSVSSQGIAEVHLTGTELGEKSYLRSNLAIRENTEKALIDGAVQAKTTSVPSLFYHDSVADCLSYFVENHVKEKVLLDVDEYAKRLSEAIVHRSFSEKKIVAAIGSERGWTDRERGLFKDAGFSSYSLGERVLRTETAAISATTLILAAMNHL